MVKSLDVLRQHRREEIQVVPNWVAAATVSGAYWFQIGDAEAEICRIHGDRVWLPIGPVESVAELSMKYGNCFYGPLPTPRREKEGA